MYCNLQVQIDPKSSHMDEPLIQSCLDCNGLVKCTANHVMEKNQNLIPQMRFMLSVYNSNIDPKSNHISSHLHNSATRIVKWKIKHGGFRVGFFLEGGIEKWLDKQLISLPLPFAPVPFNLLLSRNGK